MRPKRQNGKELFWVALAAIALGIFNFALQRFVDGSLCIITGAVILLIWKLRR